MAEPSPQTLVLSMEEVQINAAKKDLQAFAPLFEKYHAALCRFAYQRLSKKEDTYEIVSLAFLKAMQNLHQYKFEGLSFGSWLYRIVLNEINMQHRSNKINRVINCEEAQFHSIADEFQDIDEHEKFKKLKISLTHLNVEELDLIEMRFFEKRTFKEIAEINNQQEAAAKMRCYRTLEKLKQIMIKNK
jgi:RNA polymerase sigma-70 factor (ECF subfamily)